MSEKYAYLRVSTREQNEERQLAAIEGYDIPKENVYLDKESGRNFDRPSYIKLKDTLKKGDLLYIKSIDRLGRNYSEILEEWRILTKVKEIDIVVIDMPLLDTQIGKDLTGILISDLVLQILSYVAENEYRNIKQRQREGIMAAKANGVKFGRPQIEVSETFYTAAKKWIRGEATIDEAAREVGLSSSTFYRKAKAVQTSNFWRMTEAWGNAGYAVVNYGEAYVPSEIKPKTISIDGDIDDIMSFLLSRLLYSAMCFFSWHYIGIGRIKPYKLFCLKNLFYFL